MAANDVNAMQAQLGLTGSGPMSPFGLPTPMPVQPMMAKHPSEAARDAVQMTQTMAMNTMQTAQAVNMASTGGSGGGFGGFGGGGWGMGGGGGGMGAGWGLNSFANQYRQNMQGIQQQQLNPWMAGSMASMMGMQGYMPGMMPSPVQMTPPSMGIFRQPPPMPMGQIPPVPPMPLFSTPLTPQMPGAMFSTPFERHAQLAEFRGIQHTSAALAAPGIIGRAGADFAGSRIGAGLGGLLGARFGGAPGAAIGAAVGAFGGMMGADHFLGEGIQGAIDYANPLTEVSRRTAQVRAMSRDFVVGGPSLDTTGRGLSGAGSARLARQLNDIAGDSGFQRQTGSAFSTQDLMKITQTSGQQGLLDMAQRPEQIASQVKSIAKALKSFMQLASEPDVTEALKQLGQMKSMGLSLGESMSAMQNAKQFSRMGGTSVRGIMEMGGLPGAMTFQQQGLSAGLGMNAGMASFGMARQAVAAGAFTPQQLSMLGGVQGVAQRSMENSAAMLNQPLMAAAMSKMGAGGSFGLDPHAVQSLTQGKLSIPEMATMGVGNLLGAVNRGGTASLASFLVDQRRVSDDLGRSMRPEQLAMLPMQQALQTMKLFGQTGRGGLAMGAMAMGLDTDAAGKMISEANSPEYFQNMQRHLEVERASRRAASFERREREQPGIMDTLVRKSAEYNGLLSQGASGLRDLGTGLGNLLEEGAGTLSQWDESAEARKTGQVIRRTPRELLARSATESRAIAHMSYKDFMAGAGDLDTNNPNSAALYRTVGGRGYGGHNAVNQKISDLLGGNADDYNQAQAAAGGAAGFFGVSGMFSSGDERRAARADRNAGGALVHAGQEASLTDVVGARGNITKQMGGNAKVATKLLNAFTNKVAEAGRNNRSFFGDKPLTQDQLKSAMAEASKETGINSDGIDLGDATKQVMKHAQTQAGYEFKASQEVDQEGYNGTIDQLSEKVERRGDDLFGGETGFMGYGESDRRKVEKLMFGGEDQDPRIALYASLVAAARREPDNKVVQKRLDDYKEHLVATDPKQADAIMEKGDTMVGAATTAGNDDLLAQVGKTATAGDRNASEMEKGFLSKAKVNKAQSAVMTVKRGYEKMGYSGKSIDAKEVMKELGSPSKQGNLSAHEKELVSAFNATSDDTKRDAIATEFQNAATTRSDASEKSTMGGGYADNEADLDTASKDIGDVGSAMTKNFPEAVATFKEASESLRRTAEHLGKNGYDPAVNP